MILIPKVPGANSMDRFRPIILSNFLFKVIAKILADRLGTIAFRIISENQFGFLKGRHIEDFIVAASECFNVMNRQYWGGNMAMKIDIKKAFDSIEWDFMQAVLCSFGFSKKFIDWIWAIFESARLSILLNGGQHGYFSVSRGVR